MVDTNIVLASTSFWGFKNSGLAAGSISLDSYLGLPPNTSVNLAPGSYIGPIRISIVLNNKNAVSQVRVQYQGLDPFWRVLTGYFFIDYPNYNSANYQIQSFSYFQFGNLIIDTYISNQLGSTVTIPPITITCQASLFVAPF